MAAAHQTPIELVLQHRISPERLAPYIRETYSLHEAIRLYRWNIDLSGAVCEALHVFDVVLRNALDQQLCTWNASQPDPSTGRFPSSDWPIDPSALLRIAARDIPDARSCVSSIPKLPCSPRRYTEVRERQCLPVHGAVVSPMG